MNFGTLTSLLQGARLLFYNVIGFFILQEFFFYFYFLLVFHTSRSCLKGREKMLCVSLGSKIKYLANASNWSLWILFFSLDLLEFFKMSPDIERNKGVRIRRHRERESESIVMPFHSNDAII